MKVKVSNPVLTGEVKTTLSQDYSSGTTLNVRNSQGFTNDRFVVVGEPGQDRTEQKDISGAPPSSTTITVGSALNFSHPKSTVVYEVDWDQIQFEKKPSGGSFSAISGSPFSIEWDNPDNTTLIDVPGGASTDTFRWRFYNSERGTYSDYSDSLSGSGISRSTAGYVVKQVRRNPITKGIDDEVLFDYINDYQQLVYEQVPKAWWFVKKGTEVSTATDDYDYSISSNWSDFLSMKFLLYSYVNGSNTDTYPLTYIPLNEFYNYKADENQSSDNSVKYWTLLPPDSSSALGYIGLHPTPEDATCSMIPVYQFELTALDSFGDSLVVPQPKGYIDYVLYRIFDDIKNDSSNADKYNARVGSSIIALRRRSRRQLGQPELFRWRGTRGWSSLYGSGGRLDYTTQVESYW